MGQHRSADEVRADHISLMGPELGVLYDELRKEVTWLHLKWNRFVALFVKEKCRIDLMNDTAPAFFSEIQRAMAEDIFIHISRLTDRAETKLGKVKKPNLTLQRLPGLLLDEALCAIVNCKIMELNNECQFARDWRNRRIAHRDLALAMQEVGYRPLESATKEKVEKALVGIRDVMNTVFGHFTESVVRYEHSIGALGDVESLIHYLEKGHEAHRKYLDELQASARPRE
jgi:hypothetical protein